MTDELSIDPEEMRALGYRAVDLLVEHLRDPRSARLMVRATREEMERRLEEPPPEEGEAFETSLGRLRDDVLPFIARQEHPGYMAFIPAGSTWPGALGDLIASGANLYAGSWMDGAGPTQLELTVLGWFAGWIGYPPEAAGIMLSGGSAANMTALACAREALVGPMSGDLVAYCSDQSHSSIARAARVLGFRPEQMRVIPTDDRFRIRLDELAAAIEIDERAGRRPLFVSANAGTTNTGAIDPLPELAALCREHGIWFHVDGAYGGFSILTERGAKQLAGIELADSVTLDPHKWLFQPFECGSLLVRDGDLLQRAFEIAPDYLHDTQRDAREVNLSDRGLQLTRSSRAIKVWLTVRYFGMASIRRTIDRSLDLAEHAERRIDASDHLELLAPRTLGVVCFRRRVPGADDGTVSAWNERLLADLESTGRALMSSTRLHGRYALRMAIVGHATEQQDVDWVLDHLERSELDARRLSVDEVRGRNVTAGLEDGWITREPIIDGDLDTVPLFAPLDEAAREDVRRAGWIRDLYPGETIVEAWDQSRDFFVVLDGTAEVDGPNESRLGPGDFFGEVAALDWGADFAYSRSATVRAGEGGARLAVIPASVLNRLVRTRPGVGEPVRRAARQHLFGD